jgi:hypothetical protein
MKILYEIDEPDAVSVAPKSVINVPLLWRYREHISLQHAQIFLENARQNTRAAEDGTLPYAVLALFFREVRDLHIVLLFY